jgi:anti-sigma B factor antagonist
VHVRAADTTVVLHGDLDLVTVERLRALLAKACAGGPDRLVIDVSDVHFMDVLSLSAILAVSDTLRERGGSALVTGAPRSVRRMCAVLNATDVLAAEVPVQRVAG